MSYDKYFFTGVRQAGDSYAAWWDGESIGTYVTYAAAKAAIKKAGRK